MKAGAGESSTRVVVAVLIEGDDVRRVRTAEDVAAAAAMVAAGEGVEVALASRIVAHGGLGVGLSGFCQCLQLTQGAWRIMSTHLPVLASGLARDLGEQFRVQVEVNDLATVAGRATRQLGANDAEAGQANEAAVGAAQAEKVLAVQVLGLGGSGHL